MWSVNNQYAVLHAEIDTFRRSRFDIFIRELQNYAFKVVADASDASKDELQAIGEEFKGEASEMYIELFKHQNDLVDLIKRVNEIKKTNADVGASQLCEKISGLFLEVENYMMQLIVISTCDDF